MTTEVVCMYANRFDSHTHSENSPDGNHSVMCLCERAIEMGLKGIIITDHMESNDYIKENFLARMEQSIFDTQKAKAVLGERIIINQGIELGQPLCDPQAAETVLALTKYDYVIGSVHLPVGKQDYYYWDFDDPAISIHETVTEYFEQLIETARWGRFDCLGHMTYLIRYIWGRSRIPVDFTNYSDYIDTLFKVLIEGGRGIEVNTSGLRQYLGEALPSLKWVKRYRELGGEIVTIGSDAHYAEDLGAGGDYAMDLLKEAGFRYFAFYKERTPRMMRLV